MTETEDSCLKAPLLHLAVEEEENKKEKEKEKDGRSKQGSDYVLVDGELRPSYHEGCPGCALARKKSSAKHLPKKELFFVAVMVLCNCKD